MCLFLREFPAGGLELKELFEGLIVGAACGGLIA